MREFWSFANDLRVLIFGFFSFLVTGQTPEAAHQHLIALFCKTRGISNDVMHKVISLFRPKYQFQKTTGVLGEISNQDSLIFANEIRNSGYLIFPKRLDEKIRERMIRFAKTAPSHPIDGQGNWMAGEVFSSHNPKSEVYRFTEEDLLKNPDVLSLMADFSILSIAQDYLNCAPILASVSLWWSVSLSQVPSSNAAQLFHFDMDRIKWLKFFFYLTPVTTENGPHCFIRKSHLARSQPGELLKRGYGRINDEEIRPFYSPDSFVEITGEAGSIFAEDTRGFHKGKMVTRGERLVFELEFCDSLFGGRYFRPKVPSGKDCPVSIVRQNYSSIYSKYEFTN